MNRRFRTLFTTPGSNREITGALQAPAIGPICPKKFWLLWALTAFYLFSSLPIFGQTHGSVSGTVVDPTGASVSGASVTVVRPDTGVHATTTTNGFGNYAIRSLAPAHYNLKVTAPGFETFEEMGLILEADRSLTINVHLKVGSTTSTVHVTATGRYTTAEARSATQTETPLIQIPQSIQVINRAVIEDQDARTLADVLVNVAGVVPTRQEEILLAAPIIHGFPAEIYQDGLAMYGSTTAANDPTSLTGVERVEVVKGPTSTLYGGGVGSPLGGLINLVSKRPESKLRGYVGFRGGSFTTRDPYGDVTIPFSAHVSARLSGEYLKSDSYIDKLHFDRWNIQPSLLFTFGPKTELFVQGMYNRRSQLEYSGLPAVQALAGQLDRNAFPGATIGQPDTVSNNRMGTLQLQHAFTDNLRLTLSGRFYNSNTPEYGSFVYPSFYAPDAATPTTYPILAMNMVTALKEGTFDTNLAGNIHALGGQHELLVGVSYDHIDFSSNMGFAGIPIGELNLAQPQYNVSFGALTPYNLTQTDHYQTTAVYGQDQATYGRLHLTGSMRYTHLDYRELEESTDKSYNRVTPRIGGTVDIVPGVSVFAGFATSFRGAFAVVTQTPPKPETSHNVEAGVKLALPQAHLAGTLAWFNQTRNNVATSDPSNILYSIQTGQQRARGAEADLTWEPIRALSVLANYAYTQAQVTEDSTIPVGDTLARVPHNSGRVAIRYRVLHGPADGLSFGAGITAFSARQITLPNTVAVPGYGSIDVQGRYDFAHHYSLEASGVNLTGRKTFDAYQYFSFPVVIPNQPRSAYVALKFHF